VTEEAGDTVVLVRTRDGKTTKEKIDMVELMRSGPTRRRTRELASRRLGVCRTCAALLYLWRSQKPGSYKLERNMIVLQALSAGGGLSPRGTERGVRIKRRDANGELQMITAKHDDLVKADDIVYVKESLF
jgi:polysaccharide export outer membrane protein